MRFIDSNGEMMDWDQSASEALLWQDNNVSKLSLDGDTYRNIGTSVSLGLSDGSWLNYYQNVAVSLSNTPINVQSEIMKDAGMAGQLLSNRSPLSESSQIGLMQSLVNKGKQDFLDHPVTQATINTLAFVATGGVEGMMALGNMGKSLIGNIKVPVYRVYGGKLLFMVNHIL